MKLVCFVAENAAAALAEVRERLGPDAVIVSVRRLPAAGLTRFWKKCRFEVTAGVPDKTSAPGQNLEPQIGNAGFEIQESNFEISSEHWRSVAWLETMGLLPAYAERLQTHLRAVNGDPPESLQQEWKIVNNALSRFWLTPPPIDDGQVRPHVFIGPPGSGKSTALCKWLTLTTLFESRDARVWRLDGSAANTAEFLAIHCEMLGVRLERFWKEPIAPASQSANAPLWFVDLPGVEISDAVALANLRSQLATLPSPRVHLVLNAAYETLALMAQWRAFELCAPEDLIFTHLDEETRRVKLWNFVFGTNCSLRFLGAGQKIPGEFRSAAPELLLPLKTL